ncbi:MAG: AraC family transcriptional regulator [Chloroflexi bacterium]|nr:AraC family transcriptional regulator [Chloroflexota bacterium]MCI0577956.1 AraC family transcriptional regulator [Chloroflexota bacterium]MCI0646118.1 AraC family transcriptional regulator [Chloroflexota bacterium]
MNDVLQKSAGSYEPRGRLDPAGFERHVSFHTYLPPADLAPFIEHFWTIRWDQAGNTYYSEEVMHRPYVDVFVSLQQSGIQGTFRGKRTYVAAGSGRIVGIRFRPGAFHAFWGGAVADLQDKIIDLQQLFPWADDRHTERLLALDDQTAIHHLIKLLRAINPQPDSNIELINKIITAIETDENLQTVKAVARRFGRSERWLQQLFQDYVGIGLKWLLQRHRLLSAAEHIRESDNPDWVAIAYDLGYSSQQHFINDFKQVLGKTPVQYKKELTVNSPTHARPRSTPPES